MAQKQAASSQPNQQAQSINIGDQIVEASAQISQSAALIVLQESVAPQKNWYYFNAHVKELMGQQAYAAHHFDKHNTLMKASLSDLGHTVEDTKQIAELNTEFGDRMIANLNKLLL